MNKFFSLTCAAFCFFTFSSAQNEYPTETDRYIFWQADRKLAADDFQGDGSGHEKSKYFSEKYGLRCVAFLGLWTNVDVPQGKRAKRSKYPEKIYISPAFEKTRSFILQDDTAGIAHEQVMFDMHELAARMLRKKLESIGEETGLGRATGTQAIFFKTLEADVLKYLNEMLSSFVTSVLIQKTDSLRPWREMVDTFLETYKEYATRPEDCARFTLKRALLDHYAPAEILQGDFREKDSLGNTLLIKQGSFPDTGTPIYKCGATTP